jgi:hypothetical protein
MSCFVFSAVFFTFPLSRFCTQNTDNHQQQYVKQMLTVPDHLLVPLIDRRDIGVKQQEAGRPPAIQPQIVFFRTWPHFMSTDLLYSIAPYRGYGRCRGFRGYRSFRGCRGFRWCKGCGGVEDVGCMICGDTGIAGSACRECNRCRRMQVQELQKLQGRAVGA